MTTPKLRVISLGAGVDSTALALMAAHGEIGPMPDCAIFADTQDEPGAVYDHLRWLQSPNVLPFPIHVVTAGSLSSALLAGDDEARVPFFVGAGGIAKRQCTRNFKIRPIRQKIREILGKPGRAYVAPRMVEQWVGIAFDERWRIKPSGVAYISRRDPLVERGIRKRDARQWLKDNGHPIPPKSRCRYCPYQSDADWRHSQIHDPDDFALSAALDRELRTPSNINRFRGELYLHSSRMPLDQIDFSSIEERGQGALFPPGECEDGMCGV